MAGYRPSVLDVEGVAEGSVKPDLDDEVEVTSRFWVEEAGRNRDEVVAADDALIRKTLAGPDFNL